LVLLLLFIALLLVGNAGLSLWDQDEAAYAGFGWHMNDMGQYKIPSFPWSEVHRKPPFHFWLIALSYKLFGATEFSTRIPSVLAILATVLIVWGMGKKLLGEKGATLAALALMSNILLVALAKISFTDATLLFFETLALLSLLNWLQTNNTLYIIWWTVALAGGMLTKGPPILIVALGTCGLLFLFKGNRAKAFAGGLLVLPAIVPIFLWLYSTVEADNGAFATWLLDWYVLKRTSGAVFGQTGPPGYHLAIGILAFIAVLPWVPGAFGQQVKATVRGNPVAIVLTGWLFFGWVFYEALPSKLPTYALAAYPALALCIGKYAPQVKIGTLFKILNGLRIGIWLLLGAAPIAIAGYTGNIISAVMAVILLGGVAFLLWLGKRSNGNNVVLKFINAFLISALVMGSVWLFAIPQGEELRSGSKQSVVWMKNHPAKSNVVAMSKNYQLPSWPTYCAWNGLQFKELKEEEWKAIYQNRAAGYMVFDDSNIGRFKEFVGNAPLNDKVINAFISDRGEKVNYHLIKIE